MVASEAPEGAGGSQVLALCGGKPLVSWSSDAVRQMEATARVVVALPAGAAPPEGTIPVTIRDDVVATLEAALAAAGPADIAILHDPCRPLADGALFEHALRELKEHRCDAVVAGEPITDTLKRVDADGRITETLPRGEAWRIQTPQVYRAAVLRRALAVARRRIEDGRQAPDDPAFVPSCVDGRVRVVGVPRDSVHVRGPADMRVAEQLLSAAR